MDLGEDLSGHQRQGIPTDIRGQVPMAPFLPRSPGVLPPEQVSTEKIYGGGHSGGDPPCIRPPLAKEEFCRTQVCYKTATDIPPPPDCIILDRIMAERVELYLRVFPPGYRISIKTTPITINDSIPSMEKIYW